MNLGKLKMRLGKKNSKFLYSKDLRKNFKFQVLVKIAEIISRQNFTVLLSKCRGSPCSAEDKKNSKLSPLKKI